MVTEMNIRFSVGVELESWQGDIEISNMALGEEIGFVVGASVGIRVLTWSWNTLEFFLV